MVISASMDAGELMDIALKHGFELIRETNHRIIKRGAMRFTLPHTGQANAWVTQSLLGVCRDIELKQAGQKRKPELLPTIVMFKGETYAVADRTQLRYQLQNLEDGRRFWVNIRETTEVNYDETMQAATANGVAPPVAIEEPPAAQPEAPQANETEAAAAAVLSQRGVPYYMRNSDAPAEEPVPRPDPLAEFDPFGAWITQTERTIERLQVKVDALYAQIDPIEDQMEALKTALETVKKTKNPTGVFTTKRTVLPPTNPPGSRHRSSGMSETQKESLLAQLKLAERGLKKAVDVARELGITEAQVSYWKQKFIADGKLKNF